MAKNETDVFFDYFRQYQDLATRLEAFDDRLDIYEGAIGDDEYMHVAGIRPEQTFGEIQEIYAGITANRNIIAATIDDHTSAYIERYKDREAVFETVDFRSTPSAITNVKGYNLKHTGKGKLLPHTSDLPDADTCLVTDPGSKILRRRSELLTVRLFHPGQEAPLVKVEFLD